MFVKESKPEKKVIKLAVTERADDIVEAFAEKFDMLKQGVVSRIYERFGALPEPVQKWFVGLTDGNEGVGMREFAKMLAAGKDEGKPPTAKEQEPVHGTVISPRGGSSRTVRNQGHEEREITAAPSRSTEPVQT
jgi:hypothetical protein